MTHNILIIDDHPLVASSFEQLAKQLALHADSAFNAKEALDMLNKKEYQLIILDISLPNIDGKSLLQLIRTRKINTPILSISGTSDVDTILWMLNNGAQGYIGKTEKPETLKQAIHTILNGGTVVPDNIQSIQSEATQNKEDIASYLGVTEKQKEVLQLMAEGKSNKQIAYTLNIAESTVSSHLKLLFSSLKVHNRTECVSQAKNLGIL